MLVESGNPADSERCLPMLRRHVETYGEPPQRVADGGYAYSGRRHVEHVMFHKGAWSRPIAIGVVYELKRFRAGVEAGYLSDPLARLERTSTAVFAGEVGSLTAILTATTVCGALHDIVIICRYWCALSPADDRST